MRSIGLFEAKAKLSELCDHVATSGEAVVITRRGTPWVRVLPAEIAPETRSVWETARQLPPLGLRNKSRPPAEATPGKPSSGPSLDMQTFLD